MEGRPVRKGIVEILQAGSAVFEATQANSEIAEVLERVVAVIVAAFRSNGKVLICGNGGSAAEAQHMAAELSGRFYLERAPLDAEALHVNTSYLTAVANDYSYDEIFARLIRAKGRPKDVLICISTSGRSTNVIKAIEAAKEQAMITVGLTGSTPGRFSDLCDYVISVPSSDTARIQEAQMLIGHAICERVESDLFGNAGDGQNRGRS
jgi:D-sedoheptulose 7-phosphate isomerase